MTKELVFLPKPLFLEYTFGEFKQPETWSVMLTERFSGIKHALGSLWPELETEERRTGSNIVYQYREMGSEAYDIEICENIINIFCSDMRGAFYALATLHQASLQCECGIPCCNISDAPGLELRGVLLDISRGKVMKLETAFRVVNLLASLKYNHLELYIEGFSFAYPSFPGVWSEEACMTADEIRQLSSYCRERFIELVPHQNSLGHMASWLSLPEFSNLAEAEEGLKVMDFRFPPTTLDASDPSSADLVARLIEDLNPCFDSDMFHVGLDEPFELGKGKNRNICREDIAEKLVLPYIEKLHAELALHGRRMMMWDDLIVKHPEIIEHLPEDIMICDWGYDAEYPVEKRAKMLSETGRDFIVCPGTSSWSSFVGLTDNMLENVSRAGRAAYEFGATGLMITDWGDMNHMQYLPISYPGIMYASAFAWNKNGSSCEELARGLSMFVFRDRTGVMGDFCLEAGRFYLHEEFRMPCRSLACLPLMFGRCKAQDFIEKTEQVVKSVTFFSPDEVCSAYLKSYEERTQPDIKSLIEFLWKLEGQLDRTELLCDDGELVVREYRNAIRMLGTLSEARIEIMDGNQETEDSQRKQIGDVLEKILEEHRSLWLARNKQSSLEDGIKMFDRI